MSNEKKTEAKHVSLDTTLIVAAVCLVVGFLGGVFYSTYKSGSERLNQPASYQAPKPGQTAVSTQQTEMILALERRVADNPSDLNAWVQLGNLYFDTDNPQKAIKAYAKHLEFNPNNPNVLTDLGVVYRRNGQFNEAIAAFDKAIEINPKHPQSWFNKGIVLLHNLNKPEAAIEAWEELIKVAPDFKGPGDQPVQRMVENIKKSLATKKP